MINAAELRLGNYLLQKINHKIVAVTCDFRHFEMLQKKDDKYLFPIKLKPEHFEKSGFKENKDYPLLPAAREFFLTLPIAGENKNEIVGYVKANGECFARAIVNSLPVSRNIFQLHELQNLFHALTGSEIEVRL